MTLSERLLTLNFVARPERDRSSFVLAVEHFRRTTLWADHLKIKGDGWRADLALAVDASLRADPDVVNGLRTRLQRFGLPILTIALAENALHWAQVGAEGRRPQVDLPEPYDPLITMLERGGSIAKQHGEVQVGLRTFAADRARLAAASRADISLERLDSLD